jgi:hypothetical protein
LEISVVIEAISVRLNEMLVPSWRAIVMRSALILLSLVMICGEVKAQYVFTRVADNNTPIPSGMGNFTFFEVVPTISQGIVCAVGYGGASQNGVYTFPANGMGTGTRIADLTTISPGGLTHFTSITDPVINNGVVVFNGGALSPIRGGWYSSPATGGAITKVVDTSDTIPDYTGPDNHFINHAWYANVDHDSTRAVFSISSQLNGNSGVYSFAVNGSGGVRIADNNSSVPGQPAATHFTNLANWTTNIDGNQVAFQGRFATGAGIYAFPSTGGSGTRVADTSTNIPSGVGTFSDFTNVSLGIANGTVVFVGQGAAGFSGLYAFPAAGGSGTRLVDSSMLIPGTTSHFSSFAGVAASGNSVVFRALGTGGEDIVELVKMDGSGLTRVIGVGDTLDGRVIHDFGRYSPPDQNLSVGIDTGSLDGDTLAFNVNFTDGTFGIYTVTIPEPSVTALMLLSLISGVGYLFWRRETTSLRSRRLA